MKTILNYKLLDLELQQVHRKREKIVLLNFFIERSYMKFVGPLV